jgi:ankyrin repeat protein
VSEVSELVSARDRLLAGDRPGLEALLDQRPELVTERIRFVDPPYDGYFHGATLLHHVPGNPQIVGLPADIVSLAELLLDRGSEVDAVTLQGPSQPDDIGWTTLGLAATSAMAREVGCQAALMDLLLARGADPDARNGGCLMGALYYGESEAAELLAKRGARLDLVAAAGLGDVATLRQRLAALEAASPDGRAGFEARRLAHYSLVPWPDDAEPRDVLGLSLVYAALHGRVEAISVLLEAGADPNHRPPFDHGATPLHWAVMGDRPESVTALLEAGADPGARDRSFHSTPAGWAAHLGRSKAAAALG